MWGRAVWALRGLFHVPGGLWTMPYDDHHHNAHDHLPAGDGPLLRRGGVLRGRRGRLRFFGVVSAGHDLQRDDVRLHWPRDPLRRPQAERWVVQLLQVGHLPARDDVPRRPERRVRLGLRLPVRAAPPEAGNDGGDRRRNQGRGGTGAPVTPSGRRRTCRSPRATWYAAPSVSSMAVRRPPYTHPVSMPIL